MVAMPICAQEEEKPDDVIRVESDLTNLLFTVSDKRNKFITTLTETDVRLLEDSIPQTITSFQKETDRPLSIAFLIDVSVSEEKTLPQEKAAVRRFIETVLKSEKDQAALIPFTGSAYLEQELTRDVFKLYRSLQRVEVATPTYLGSGRPLTGIASRPGGLAEPVGGSTAIWEAVVLTNGRVLAPAGVGKESQRRRVIILLTDGWDTSSRVNMQDAITSAISAETVIYAIGIGNYNNEGVDKGSLRSLSERTGGRSFFPSKEVDLQTAFAEIEREVRSQYLITYSSSNKNRNGAFRKVEIEISNPELKKQNLRLRHRPGYFATPLQNSGQ